MASVKEKLEIYGIKKALGYLENNPQENVPKVLNWLRKFDKDEGHNKSYDMIEGSMTDPKNNWNRLISSLYTDIDESYRKKAFENMVVNFIYSKRIGQYSEKYDCNIPWAILMDPTSACNLKCTGCWAAEYGHKLSLTLGQMDDIIRQGKEFGCYMYILSGGEPLVRKDDILKLCDKHNDCTFLAFTNGTLIDEEFADNVLKVNNFVPAISIEGYEEETDSRRGKGTYKAVLNAMRILREKKLPFGTSLCYTSKNAETIGSSEYFDFLIEQGCKFAWLFTYIPVGADASLDLIATAQQRKYMYDQIRKFRETKPIFTMDFWNDGEYVNGCVAGGRSYLHINANGDIEPCAFIHYSDSNIKDKTILQACMSPLFMEYRRNQPFNHNQLRPCPLLDNPARLVQMVKNSGAKSTDMLHPEKAEDLTAKCLDAAKDWAETSKDIWDSSAAKERCAVREQSDAEYKRRVADDYKKKHKNA